MRQTFDRQTLEAALPVPSDNRTMFLDRASAGQSVMAAPPAQCVRVCFDKQSKDVSRRKKKAASRAAFASDERRF
jgi:hypothetical protein